MTTVPDRVGRHVLACGHEDVALCGNVLPMAEELDPESRDTRLRARIEFVATVLLAFATILTAWSAFQSTKWSGTQAVHFARASADRTEAAKAASLANSQTIVDVDSFLNWVGALAQERMIDPNASTAADGTYQPDPDALSGFLYQRFRQEFKPAIEAWLAKRPLENPAAPPTPFALPEYDLAQRRSSDRLEARSDREGALARRDNQRGDNYVLTTVLFASVLFFAGIGTKLTSTRNRLFTISLAVTILIAGVVILASFPIQI